jgi:methylenetetrahydrofolate reductase (NADPH)
MARAITVRDESARMSLKRAFETLSYEVIPLKSAEDGVLAHVPTDVRLTITASPTKGQDATIALAERLEAHGYSVAPHLSAQQVIDRAHLSEIVQRLHAADVREVFVVGGDRTETPTAFRDAHDLLEALHDLDHELTDIGIGGHPEGHPAVPDEVLDHALDVKAPLAHHIATQICFDPHTILAWSRRLKRRGTDLPIRVGMPGSVHRQKLVRVSSEIGVGESARFLRKQHNLLWRFFVPGGYRPDRLIKSLSAHLDHDDNGIAGFHIFTFNDLQATEAWRQQNLASLSA